MREPEGQAGEEERIQTVGLLEAEQTKLVHDGGQVPTQSLVVLLPRLSLAWEIRERRDWAISHGPLRQKAASLKATHTLLRSRRLLGTEST